MSAKEPCERCVSQRLFVASCAIKVPLGNNQQSSAKGSIRARETIANRLTRRSYHGTGRSHTTTPSADAQALRTHLMVLLDGRGSGWSWLLCNVPASTGDEGYGLNSRRSPLHIAVTQFQRMSCSTVARYQDFLVYRNPK